MRPVKTNWISQRFGENRLPIYKERGMLGHNGIDFASKYGEPIYWPCVDYEGMVYQHHIDTAGGYGIDILAKTEDKVYKLRFWHLVKGGDMPRIGTTLSTGDLVGYADNTGHSKGNHLHFGLKPQVIDKFGNYRNEFPDNKYYGAIDPMPFYNNIYVRDYMVNLTGQVTILKRIIYLIKNFISGR